MPRLVVLLFLVISVALNACGISGVGLESQSLPLLSEKPRFPENRELTVFAAASLTDVFQEMGDDFEADNPGVRVKFNFAGSQVLRTQIEQGAEVDIFASADQKNMDGLATEDLVIEGSFQDFAFNRMVVILPEGNPKGLDTLHDLATPGLKLILADSSVPAGSYARLVLSNLRQETSFGVDFYPAVLANIVSNETDVRQVVTKVELGEADAGMVYSSDAVAAPELETILIPEQFNIVARYPIAMLANSPNPDLAEAFISYVLSPKGQTILEKWGFTTEH